MEFPNRPDRNPAVMLLRDLIHERTGVFFSDSSVELMMDKLSGLIAERGSGSLIDFYYHLKYDRDESQWSGVLDAISVRETYFWREFDQIHALTDIVLPRLAESARPPLKIWSAACATGEEPLTIAMALSLTGWFDRLPIEIHASDASDIALQIARKGVYRERSFRALPAEYRSRFFTPGDDGLKIKQCLHEKIQWHRVNLADRSSVERLAQVPVIFCRNVFIYFSESAILRTAKLFEQYMQRPGYLFLGAAESLLKFNVDFELQELGGAFAYVRD
ncbi:MAG TPA: protein-glutamate O-methyltransferase CheR [Terriglobia bacterium]|jgi:chemotaxis protein methyltransferase CheR